MEQRKVPFTREAEQSVLGAMMLDGEVVSLAMEHLTPEDFYLPQHQVLYTAMRTLYETGKPIDLVTAMDALAARGTLEGVGGIAYLTELQMMVPATANAGEYIRLVEEKALLRKLIGAAGKIDAAAHDAPEGPAPVMEMAEKEIFNLSLSRSKDAFVHIRPTLVEVYSQLEQTFANKDRITGLSTGFTLLDNMTSGLHPAEMILVAARPSMGKTAFVMNVAQHVALHEKVPVAVFSLEMSREQLVNRLLCAESMVSLQKARTGDLSHEDWKKLVMGMSSLSTAPVFIDDTPGITLGEMRSKCRRLKLEHGLGLIVIDYLQLMSGGGKGDNRQQEISEISRGLKILSREMSCPVIALSQLSRAPEQRPNHRPILSDLRESGAIEQDADIVMFLYRDAYYNKDNPDSDVPENVAELSIAKQRNGPTGTIKLCWLGEYTRFTNLGPDQAPM